MATVRALAGAALLLAAACLASCSSRRALELFFDVPEKPPAAQAGASATGDRAAADRESSPAGGARARADAGFLPPAPEALREKLPTEKSLKWEEVEPLLPKDELGEVDWMEAMRSGIIDPRSSVDPGKEPFLFKFDFHFLGAPGTLGAYFPHSAHTQWLSCESCHPGVFPQPGTPLSMAKILSGDFCGKCHTTVAFPIAKGCKRCHANKS